jgi:hypothetical protein
MPTAAPKEWTYNPNEFTVESSKALGVPTALLSDVLRDGGGVGPAIEYMLAQLAAGLVPAPSWATEPEPAR